MAHEFSTVAIGDLDPKPSAGSGTDHVDLAGELGCTEMVPKVWYLSPGDAMSYHRQAEQEEFYLPLEGPGRLRIGDEVHDIEEGTAVRIPPETPRQVLNDTEAGLHRWLIIGAPAVEDDGRPVEE